MKFHPFRSVVLCLGLLIFKAAATTYYVDINSTNPTPPYTSWATAATNIQAAVNQTVDGDLVLVNPGVYHSVKPGGYVGPDGNGSSVLVSHAITLQSVSGAQLTSIDGSHAERCVYVSDGAALIGFTITNGLTKNSGGGVLCATTNALISSCLITENNAGAQGYGGGAYLGTLSNCTLMANSAMYGGALYSGAAIDCVLSSNSASFYGGGAYLSALTNCLIVGNESSGYGGGVNTCIINNCTVVYNYAGNDDGGVDQPSTPYNCIIYYNTSGGVYPNFQTGMTLNYCCTFPTPIGPGNTTNAPLFLNVTNDFQLEPGSPCVDTGNNSYVILTNDLDGNPRIFDGIVDMGAYEYQGFVPIVAAIQADNTNVVTGYPFQLQGIVERGIASLISWDFGDGSTATNQYSVSHAWAAPGTYTVTLLVSNEFDPEISTTSLTVNVAAPTVYYVNANGANPVAPYDSWNTAATNIQDAVDAAAYDGATVLVTNGVYDFGGETVNGFALTNRVVINKSIFVQSVNGPAMTVIQGNPSPGTNAVRCAWLAENSSLVGFALTEGATLNSGDQINDQSGGGVFCQSSNQEVINCVVSNNNSVYCGAGIYQGTLNNCLVANNFGSNGLGGGAFSSSLTNCTIIGNFAGYGGGLYSGAAVDCILSSNSATAYGGGVYASSGGVFSNCIVTGNAAADAGGGALGGLFINSIISGNTCVTWPGSSGGGAAGSGLVNCILSHNFAYQGGAAWGCSMTNCTIVANSAETIAGSFGGSTVDNSIAYLNTDQSGYDNTNDPSFVNFGNNDYHLQANSPCINAGNNAYVTTPTDLDGNPRIVGGIVDLGAYEYQAATIAITAQPQPAAQTNILGQTLFLNVDAVSPYPLSYQWLFDSNSIAGATNSSLVISNLQLIDTGYYSVAISNSFFATNSSAVFLSVIYPPPAIVQQPANLAVILGSNTMLSVTSTSYLDMTFQWQLNGTNLIDQGEFYGSASSNLLIIGAEPADAGNYDVIVSDSEWSVTSAVATVSIFFPATITLQPTNETAVVPNNVSISAAASGTGPLGFQWFFNGTPLTDTGNISGSGSSTLNISGVQLTNAGVYQVLATNSFSEALSATSTLSVFTRAQILTEPTNEAVLISNTANFSVTATGTGLGYQWYFNGAPLSDENGIVGSGSANLTITDVQSGNGGNYQVIVSNAVNAVSSTIATLTPQTNSGPSIRYVSVSNSAPASPYLTWSTAATNIQNAIDASIGGDTIIVTDGVYQAGGEIVPGNSLSDRVVINKPLTVQSVNGPGSTFILGSQGPANLYDPQATRCVYMTNGTTLIGFTLANGGTLNNGTGNDDDGGGVWCATTNSATVSNCVLAANSAYYLGGGAYQGTLLNCILLGNQAGNGGGVANAFVYRSLIVSNTVKNFYNYSLQNGGGAYNCSVFSSAFAENSAGYEGGGAYGGSVENCTITENSAQFLGGGIANCGATNCIIYYNQIFSNQTGSTNYNANPLYYCCTTPKPGLPGNITNEPVLASISHISLNSPCRGAGDPGMTIGTDIDGNPWANPPSIGCSELIPGSETGSVTVAIFTSYTNQPPGYLLTFVADINGPAYTSIWNFGDGTTITNEPYAVHTWTAPGIYPVTLTAYNDSYPTGITTTLVMDIAAPAVNYVNLANPNPLPPYSHWSTAATNIQDAVNVAAPSSLVLVTNPTVLVPRTEFQYSTNYVAVYQYGGMSIKGTQFRVGITNPITVQSVNGPAFTCIYGNSSGNGGVVSLSSHLERLQTDKMVVNTGVFAFFWV